MQLLERKASDGSEIFYVEHLIEEGTTPKYLLIECTTKQQAIGLLRQLHATNDIYVENREATV